MIENFWKRDCISIIELWRVLVAVVSDDKNRRKWR